MDKPDIDIGFDLNWGTDMMVDRDNRFVDYRSEMDLIVEMVIAMVHPQYLFDLENLRHVEESFRRDVLALNYDFHVVV